MMESVPVSGSIEATSFPHLLVDLHRHGATGSLKVTGPTHPKALYFRGGRILFGSSNDPRDQLGSILIESGKITQQQLEEVTTKVGPGNPLAKVLADSGFVNQRELGDAARTKVERIVADVLSWSSGSFEFEDGVLPKGAVDLKLSTEKLLLAAVQRIPDRAFALRHIGLQTVFEPTLDGAAALAEIRADVWPLLERFDGQRTLKDAIALTRLDEFEAAKTACALLFLRAIRAKPQAEGEELDLAKEAQSGFADSETPVPAAPVPAKTPDRPPFVEPTAPEEPEPPVFAFESEPAAPAGSTSSPSAPVIASPAESEPFPGFVHAEPVVAAEAAPELPPEAPTFILPPGRLDSPPAPGGTAAFQPPAFEPPPFQPPAFEIPAFAPPRDPPPTAPPEPGSSQAAPVVSAPPAMVSTPEPTLSRPEPPSVPLRPQPFPAPATRLDPAPRSEPPSPPTFPDIPIPKPAPSRPTHEDLAALDALLSPMAARNRAPERPQPEKWQPQFRPSPQPTQQPRRAPARVAPASPSRVPLLLGAVAGIAIATVAAWYFLLRPPAAPRPVPTPAATPVRAAAKAPPVTTAPASPATAAQSPPLPAPSTPSPAPSATATARPAPAAGSPTPAPRPTDTASRPAASPQPARAATPAPVQPQAKTAGSATVADARALLGQGAQQEAARAFVAALASRPRGHFSIQLLTACAPETVQKAVAAAPGNELFILPVTVQGRGCFRVCWGLYENRPAAESGLASVPAYFRQGGARPRLSTLGELLP